MKKLDILIVGVGGQGTLLASRILGKLAALRGQECKLSEVHGMAQRGGSVVTHVKIADRVYSPIVTEGECDVILAFEKLEAVRYSHYLATDGVILVNDQEIYPMPVITGDVAYPTGLVERMSADGHRVVVVNAAELAVAAGNIKTVNTVMIGVLARELGIAFADIESALLDVVPQKLAEVNRRALSAGYNRG